MGLYPSILFHFTNRANFNSILKDTFKLSYARESIIGKTNKREFGVPMVSFCDLRLSELKDHIESYGKYGIGLTKEWAYRKGLNPVFYVTETSSFTDNFLTALNEVYRTVNKIIDPSDNIKMSKTYMNLLNTYRYIKNYQGVLKRRNQKPIYNYRFANEREWRYVAPITDDMDYHPFVPISRINTKAKKKELNNKISHKKLSFQPDDINYLIVENDSDINGLIKHLGKVKIFFSTATKERLASRILTFDQIKNDI